MSVPKPIHKYLLGEGFRYCGRGGYCKFLPVLPVAHYVYVGSTTWGGEPVTEIRLNLLFPTDVIVGRVCEDLCNDGLLHAPFNRRALWRPGEQDAQALEVLRGTLHKWLDARANPDIMVAVLDYIMGLRDTPPELFDYLTDFYYEGEVPKMTEEAKRRIDAMYKDEALADAADAFASGDSDTLPAALQGLEWYFRGKKERGGQSFSRLMDKTCYLLLAGRYAEAENLLLTNATMQKFNGNEDYRWMLACVQQKKLIVPDSFREWAEKKKLIAPGTWESVPDSTFEDAGKQADAGDMEDMYAIFFSGGRKAAAAFVQAQHGVNITKRRGKRVEDALDAACDDDESQLILCAPNRRWSVLMGSVAQVADEEGEDTALSRHLSAASKTGKDGAGSEVLFICSQDTAGALWLEYHRNGECLRQWACADGEVLANTGAPLGELDARTFGAEIGEDGPPESGTLMELAEKITGIPWDALCTPGAVFALE